MTAAQERQEPSAALTGCWRQATATGPGSEGSSTSPARRLFGGGAHGTGADGGWSGRECGAWRATPAGASQLGSLLAGAPSLTPARPG